MDETVNYICRRVDAFNPIHSKKLKKNLEFFDDRYDELATDFFKRYKHILQLQNKTLDYSIDCYLQMIADMNTEAIEFSRTGKYAYSTFEEVNSRVYAQPEIMEYHMHGLILSQFLWKHHYQVFDYFITTLPHYINTTRSYLEVGAGHGLYLSKALEILDRKTKFTVVDISKTSIELAKSFTNDDRVEFNLKDIFDFKNGEKYDLIVVGEVLEHVEAPLNLLLKLNDLLSDDGTLFITTPTNAPSIDHIYLFNTIDEIRDMMKAAGFEIESERAFLSEDVSPEKATKHKVAILYGAFLKKQ